MSKQESDIEDESVESLTDENYIGEYVGERLDDETRDGFGRAILPSRDQYEGEYRHGLRNGSGKYWYRNGGCYNGEWRKGLKDGYGKFNYPDGSYYCGLWKKGLKHGFGKYIYRNYDIYEGTWKRDIRHGIGSYLSCESCVSFKATWIDGYPKGPIEIFYPNFHYHGYWNKTHPIGEGVFTFGTKYILSGHIEMFKNADYVDLDKPSNEVSSSSSSSKAVIEQKEKEEVEDVGEVEMKEEEHADSMNENLTNVKFPKCLPHFIAHEITQYDYSHLPQHPIPPPQSDSDISICCTKSSASSGADEVHLYQVHSPFLVSVDCNEDAENEFNCTDTAVDDNATDSERA